MSPHDKTYYQSLDGMRGVGIGFVLTYHFLLLSDYSWSTIGFSWIWIQMFFVQSGFLITRALMNHHHCRLRSYLGRFYWRRIIRIFPVYFGYLALLSLLYLVVDIPTDFTLRLPYLASFTYNFSDVSRETTYANLWFIHFWSLSAEEQFYLIWPIFLFFVPLVRIRWLLVGTILFAPLFRYWLVDGYASAGMTAELVGRIAYTHTFSHLDAFAVGAAIPIFRLQERISHAGRWTLVLIAVMLITGAGNYLLLMKQGVSLSWTSLGFSIGMIENFQHVWSYSIVNLLFMFAILYAIDDRYRGIFHYRPFVRAGKIVYGMYIIHMAVLLFADRVNREFVHNVPVMLVIGCAITFALADLSYRHYEMRFLAKKDRPWRLPPWQSARH